MKNLKLVLIAALLIAIQFFVGCKKDTEPDKPDGKEDFAFSGTVYEGEKALKGVIVEMGEHSYITDNKGIYLLKVSKKPENGRFVLNVSKNGYGFVSKVYFGSAMNENIGLKPATVVPIDISQASTIQSANSNCDRSYENPLNSKTIQPKLYKNGILVDFRVPENVANILKQRNDPNSCALGAIVAIPANSIVNMDDSDPSSGEDIFMSIINLDPLTTGGMPGDLSAIVNERQNGYMESFGAVSIELYGAEKKYKLRKGTKAELTIPVNPYINKEFVPSKIPLLSYNRNDGIWYQEGSAVYDEDQNAFKVEVDHFSEFNMDMLKVDQACATFCLTALNDDAGSTIDIACAQDDDGDLVADNNSNSEVRITAIAPSGATYTRTNRLQCNSCTQPSLCASTLPGVERSCLYNYSIYNLFPGPNSYILIEHFQASSSVLIGLYVIDVGETKDNSTTLVPGCGTDAATAYVDCKQFIPVKIPQEGDADFISNFTKIPLALNDISGTTVKIVFLYNSDPTGLTFEYSLRGSDTSSLPGESVCNICEEPWGATATTYSPLTFIGVGVDPDEDGTDDYYIIEADITGLASTVQYLIKIRELASGIESTCVYANIP